MVRTQALAGMACGAAALLAFGAGPALAASGSVHANLESIEGSEVDGSGTAMVQVDGRQITVTMAAMGLLADNPHAAHIHFGADARHECPDLGDDENGNGRLNTSEGAPAYGPVVVSLTKTGDTSPDSTLAIDRFDTAKGGEISYERGSIKVSTEVANAIADGEAVVVVHGVDHNDNGKYDGKEKSDLDPKLPAEATDPALCGALTNAPHGGMETGFGGAATAGVNSAMIGLGGGAVLAAAGFAAVAARRSRSHA
jgi:hypothetical protein